MLTSSDNENSKSVFHKRIRVSVSIPPSGGVQEMSVVLSILGFLVCGILSVDGAVSLKERFGTKDVSVDPTLRQIDNQIYYPFDIQQEFPSLCDDFSCKDVYRTNITAHAMTRALRTRRPVVLSMGGDSPVQHWKALKWNLWYWASTSWPMLSNVLRIPKYSKFNQYHKNIFLLHDDDKESIDLQSLSDNSEISAFSAVEVEQELLLWDFLTQLDESPSQGSLARYCRFYSTTYKEMEDTMKLREDTSWGSLRLQEELGIPSSAQQSLQQQLEPQLSILSPGCALQLRYSDYHTTRVQVLGSARYTLLSPRLLVDLGVFPIGSSAAFQSQINLLQLQQYWQHARGGDGNEDILHYIRKLQQEESHAESLQVVTLKAGEALVVPAGYAVMVEAQTLIVCIDILSASMEQVIAWQIATTPLPMTRFADSQVKSTVEPRSPLSFDERVVFTQVFLAHVISRVRGVKSIADSVNRVLSTRLESLAPKDSMSIQQLYSQFDCFQDRQQEHEDLIKRMDPMEVERIADLVAKKINSPVLALNGFKWILVGNYIEGIIRAALPGKSLDWIQLFLTTCLNLDMKIETVEEVEGPTVMKLDPIY